MSFAFTCWVSRENVTTSSDPCWRCLLDLWDERLVSVALKMVGMQSLMFSISDPALSTVLDR